MVRTSHGWKEKLFALELFNNSLWSAYSKYFFFNYEKCYLWILLSKWETRYSIQYYWYLGLKLVSLIIYFLYLWDINKKSIIISLLTSVQTTKLILYLTCRENWRKQNSVSDIIKNYGEKWNADWNSRTKKAFLWKSVRPQHNKKKLIKKYNLLLSMVVFIQSI